MNQLKAWIQESRKQERRAPERYLSHYEGRMTCDDKHVWMTQDVYEEIVRNCGRYDGTLPTGEYCGKMFMRGPHLMWFGISGKDPMTNVGINAREVLIRPNGSGPARRPDGV